MRRSGEVGQWDSNDPNTRSAPMLSCEAGEKHREAIPTYKNPIGDSGFRNLAELLEVKKE